MKNTKTPLISRRTALAKGGQLLTVIGIASVCSSQAFCKTKASREDFFYQDEPGDGGKICGGCINFIPKGVGKYGVMSGDCSLLEGDVSVRGYCTSWTDKRAPNAKKAGT
jgi:hypothetical protein